MDQHFNGPVGQVAGGNIHNHGPVTWGQYPTDYLLEQESEWTRVLWKARRRLFFNLPLLFTILGMLGMLAYGAYLLGQIGSADLGSSATHIPYWMTIVYVVFCVGLPMHLFLKRQKRECIIISKAQVQLANIDVELVQRGDR